jgi:UDP-N-acetylmuramyl pentapeptide phosphotransferase/UDP-N-acetylglucosamine-1-phosphate transferase
MTPAILLMVCTAVALGAWVATWAVLGALMRHGVYDRPNPRSSHDAPRPRGGGLALLPVLLAAWTGVALWSGGAPSGFWPVLGGAAVLAVVSWIDDLRSLSAVSRLIASCHRFWTASPRRCCGSGSSTCSISWTASTA